MSRRDERRRQRVDDHRLKKWEQISERKAVFLEMTEITSQSILEMLSLGLSTPSGFTVNRELDDADYMFNTPLFKSELERYLSTIVATEAEYQDPDGVDELVQLAETTNIPILYNLPTTVLESHAELADGDVITVSEHNLRTYDDEVPPLDLNLVADVSELPPEIQLQITDQMTCAQKIIAKTHSPTLAIDQCSIGKCSDNIHISLDQRPSSIEVYHQNGSEIQHIRAGVCYQERTNYHEYRWKENQVQRFDLPFEDRPYWSPGMTVLEPVSRRKRGCICNTILFKYPSLLRERSILRSLAMTGVRPPKNDHICLRVKIQRKGPDK